VQVSILVLVAVLGILSGGGVLDGIKIGEVDVSEGLVPLHKGVHVDVEVVEKLLVTIKTLVVPLLEHQSLLPTDCLPTDPAFGPSSAPDPPVRNIDLILSALHWRLTHFV
jgi:hypothetical protein